LSQELKMSRYDHLIHEFEKQYNYWGDFMPPYQAYFRGHDCMPGSSFYASYRCYMKEAFVDIWPNFHSEEEYLCFTGMIWLIPGAPLMPRSSSGSGIGLINWKNT
jgi:hypothetical protein